MAELVSRLAAVDVTQLPRLAVLFFEREDDREVVRALLRGDVRVLAESGQTVAHGADVLTWQEVRLADLPRIEVDLGGKPRRRTRCRWSAVRFVRRAVAAVPRARRRRSTTRRTVAGFVGDDAAGRQPNRTTVLEPEPRAEELRRTAPEPTIRRRSLRHDDTDENDADDPRGTASRLRPTTSR